VDALLRQGVALRERGRDEEALGVFLRALEASGEPRVLAQVALAEQALGRFGDAEQHLAQALARRDDPWIGRNLAVLEMAQRDILGHLGVLVVSCSMPGASLRVPGREPLALPLSSTLSLAPGTLTIEVRAEGFRPESRAVTLRAGSVTQETFSLTPLGDRPPGGTRSPSRLPLVRALGWASLLSGGVALTVGLVGTGLREEAVGAYNTDPRCVGTAGRDSDPVCRGWLSQGDTAVSLQNVGFIAGGTLLVSAAALLVVTSLLGREAPRSALACAPGAASVSCGWSF
jgi:tetratricopeptide (TPR) repeat protein